MTVAISDLNQDTRTMNQLNIIDNSPLDMLASRRSVLAAQLIHPGPTSEELDQILEIGVRVPDHGRMTPWRIQVMHRNAQRELGELFVSEFLKSEPDAAPERLQLERIRPQRSPVLIIVSTRIVQDREGVPPVEQLLSAGNVCFNILHATTAMGYGAQWVTNWPAFNDTIKKSLGIPARELLVGFIHIGTPKGPPSERARPEITEVVSHINTLSEIDG